MLLEQQSPRWLYWLVGSALSPEDLARAGVEHAAAAIVVNESRAAPSFGAGMVEEAGDTRALLDALSLRYRHPHLKCVLHLHRHAQSRQLRLLGTHAVLETAPLTQFLLGISGTCQGAATLLLHLLQPSSGSDETATSAEEITAEPQQQRLKQEMVPSTLVGMSPLDAATMAYTTAGVLLLACHSNVGGSGASASLGPLLHAASSRLGQTRR